MPTNPIHSPSAAVNPSNPDRGEPVAWEYELATRITHGPERGQMGYEGFDRRISFKKPNVPDGTVRNLRPLYSHPPVSAEREALEKAIQICERYATEFPRFSSQRDAAIACGVRIQQELLAALSSAIDPSEQVYLEDNIQTVAFHLGQPGASLRVSVDGSPRLLVDPGEVLKEVSRRLQSPVVCDDGGES